MHCYENGKSFYLGSITAEPFLGVLDSDGVECECCPTLSAASLCEFCWTPTCFEYESCWAVIPASVEFECCWAPTVALQRECCWSPVIVECEWCWGLIAASRTECCWTPWHKLCWFLKIPPWLGWCWGPTAGSECDCCWAPTTLECECWRAPTGIACECSWSDPTAASRRRNLRRSKDCVCTKNDNGYYKRIPCEENETK